MDFIQLVNKLDKGYLSINKNLCSWIRHHKSSCHRCLEACPQKSIRLDKEIIVDDEQCDGCGICLAICPTGVFQPTKEGDREIISWIKGHLEQKTDKILRIQCKKGDQNKKGLLYVSCLGRLTENILLGAFAYGAEEIALRKGNCPECPWHTGEHIFRTTLNLTHFLAQLVGIDPTRIREVESFPEDNSVSFHTEVSLSRRGLFRAFKGKALEKASELLPERTTKIPGNQWAHYDNPRRRLLLEILQRFPRLYPVTVKVSEDLPFADLEISNDCLGCNVCETLCPPGAIERKINDGRVIISFDPRLCTNCYVCQGVCWVKAIKNKEPLYLTQLFTQGKRELIQLEERVCKFCGTHLLGVRGDYCPSCLNKRN